MSKRIDLAGQTFGWLKVMEYSHTAGRKACWKCECLLCGGEKIAVGRDLKSEDVKSCGCVAGCVDITGNVFGHLKAIRPIPWKKHNKSQVWLFECLLCGNLCEKSSHDVKSSGTSSCNCKIKIASANNAEKARESLVHIDNTTVSRLNSKISKNNTSGVKGVSWHKVCNCWCAYITYKRKRYGLGHYTDLSEAIKARKNAEQVTHEAFLEWYKKYKDNLDDAPESPDGSELEKII